jgi:hypothetical protein
MGWTLERVSLAQGEYRGLLRGDGSPPEVRAVLDGAPVPGLEITAVPGVPGGWQVTCPVPAEMIADALRVLTFEAEGDVLDTLAVAAGGMVEADVRAEIEVLRAELALVKTALRRIASQ